jgi:choline-sulfatase
VVALAAAGWLALERRTPRASAGVDLGALPRGVARAQLNLVVITLDTLRADHLGAYGSTDVETPVLDRLAAEGVLFAQAMTTAPLTLPAHASIFTGKFPPEHGVRDNGGFFLGDDQDTLAELLHARRFRTGGFVAAYVLDGKWGIGQGFEKYVDDFDLTKTRGRSLGNIQRPGNEVVDAALPWLADVAGDRFFAWIHLYDPHTPYAPPEPFRSRYAGHPYRGEVAFTDAQVGRIVEFLESRGLLDRTVVAVIGDHGESLGDHGEHTHGFFIYESAARVPFIIRAPFDLTRGRRVDDPVRAVDLMPTVLDLLGLPVPEDIAGVSLVPLMTGARQELGLEGYAEAMYPLHHYGWSELVALRSGRYKLIDAPAPELFDLDRDPHETTNIFEERRALGDRMVARLRQKLDAFEHAHVQSPAADVDPEVRARLAALGYVGSFVASAGGPRTSRADPKAKIDLFNLMGAARDASQEPGSFDTVVGLLRRVTAADPNVIDAWFSLGNAHFREGRYREAIDYFARAIALKPEYDLAVINMAAAYRNLGDDEAALAGFEHYLTIDPKDAYVRYQIGEIYLDRGDLARAETVFTDALALNAKVAPARNALGVIAFKRGDLAGAERAIREAIALRPDVRLARYNLALIAEERGDMRQAEREYLQELEVHPDSYKAAFNLSRLYEAMGDRQLQIDALRQAIEGNPRFAEGHVFLAKAYLDGGERYAEAIDLARKGLDLAPRSDLAPLGHYVLADLYNRLGRADAAAREASLGRALEARLRAAGRDRGE